MLSLRVKLYFACLLVLLLSSGTASVLAEVPKITQAELVRRTQELYDAVVPGDQTPWKNIIPTIAFSTMRKAAV